MARTALAFSIMPDSSMATIVEWAKEAENTGFDGVFMTEANNDSLACSLVLGYHTRHLTLGTAITNIYLRHPNLLANETATLHEFTDGRFILGLGTGHRESNSNLGIDMGAPADPMKKMRETVAVLRKLLEGGRTNPKINGKVPLYLAGVSRPMVRLAGEIADGV
ncbi:MAG: LLM class flavin-dependent oxidoreductase, partial [Candidatus Binataceae bacterium]